MDLETYESDLADYSLQDSPFYEASHPMIFDLSMSAVNSLMATNVASGSGKGALMLKQSSSSSSSTSHATDAIGMPTNYSTSSSTNGRNETTSMRFEMSHRPNMIGRPSGNKGVRIAPVPLELIANTSASLTTPMSTNGQMEPTKKKRKCVSFLPNYVQVNIYSISSSSFIQLNSYLYSMARLSPASLIILTPSPQTQIANRLQIYLEWIQNV